MGGIVLCFRGGNGDDVKDVGSIGVGWGVRQEGGGDETALSFTAVSS